MLLSEHIEQLKELFNKEGDMTVACMTSPFNNGESEVLDATLINVINEKPNNGECKTDKILAIGYK